MLVHPNDREQADPHLYRRDIGKITKPSTMMRALSFQVANLQEIATDERQTPLARAVARLWQVAVRNPIRQCLGKAGELEEKPIDPTWLRAIEVLFNRMEGMPQQAVTVTTKRERSPEELRASLTAMLSASPHLAAMLAPHAAMLPESMRGTIVDGVVVEASTHDDSQRVPSTFDREPSTGGEAPQRAPVGGWGTPSIFQPPDELSHVCVGKPSSAANSAFSSELSPLSPHAESRSQVELASAEISDSSSEVVDVAPPVVESDLAREARLTEEAWERTRAEAARVKAAVEKRQRGAASCKKWRERKRLEAMSREKLPKIPSGRPKGAAKQAGESPDECAPSATEA
jgi:hypothetical protein